MKRKGLLVLLLLLVSVLLSPVRSENPSLQPANGTSSNSEVLLTIQPLKDTFYVEPGDVIAIQYNITNVGSSSLENIVVYVTGPSDAFQYGITAIRKVLAPGESVEGTITVTVLNPSPGNYTLRLVAKAGDFYSEVPIVVIVKPVIDFKLEVSADKKYVYGSDVGVVLKITSKSNTLISGRIGYILFYNGTPLENVTLVDFVRPGGMWKKELLLKKPEVGNYTILFWAYLNRVYRETSASFEVYRRNLSYTVDFKNGFINVFVYGPDGRGVEGIKVYINGVEFLTSEGGTVTYSAKTPGIYNVVLDLDGRIVSESVAVSQLTLDVAQKGDKLIVRVRANNQPVEGITLSVSGPSGTAYALTNSSGIAVVDLKSVGYGTLFISAESENFLGTEMEFTVTPPETPTPTPTHTQSTTTTHSPTSTTPVQPPVEEGSRTLLAIILLGLGVFGATLYPAFFMPKIQEESLGRHHFIKVKAPRLRPLENFRLEKPITALEVRSTKGSAKIEDSRVVWEIERLEPGEEAYLQVLLG